MLVDLNRPAELARLAARAAAEGSSLVRIEVQHLASVMSELGVPGDGQEASRTPDSREYVTLDRGKSVPQPADLLIFSSSGHRFQATTWPAFSGDDSKDPWKTERYPVGRMFHGFLTPNPGFLYDHTESFEVLLSIEPPTHQLHYRDSLFMIAALQSLAEAAAVYARAPILFLQAPVAPASESAGDGSRETTRPAHGSVIRMAVGIDRSQSQARLAMMKRVDEFAGDWGLRLHMRDRRFRRIRGEWFEVRDGSEQAYLKKLDEHYGAVPALPPSNAVLVTIVGPARVGSTLSITSRLLELGIGVLGCSVTALSEMAVINLLIPVSPDADASLVASSGSRIRPVDKGIASLKRLCSLGDAEAVANVDHRPSSGYWLLASEPGSLDCTAFRDHTGPYPVWVAWDIPVTEQSACSFLDVLLEAIPGLLVENCDLAYARERRVPDGRLHGRAKLALTLTPSLRADNVAVQLRKVSEETEERTRSQLFHRYGLTPENCRIRVTPRERWLGRWHLPI